jgi:serine/threonine protein kinase
MSTSRPDLPNHERLLREALAGANAATAAGPSLADLQPHFADYELHREIGRGGMGTVLQATHKRLGRQVALKILPKELAARPEFGERFAREARALAALNHPNIVAVHDYGEVDGWHFVAMEYVEGVNLRQLLALGDLSPQEALRITPLLCAALQYAHERGVVHRDVKPENILVSVDGDVKIADFGLAKLRGDAAGPALTRDSAVFGTPHYMAPEQWRKTAEVDHRADIYALGVVLYEMLTGELPLGDFAPPSQRAGVPAGLDQIVRRALAQQPEKRYQQVREVRTDVERQAAAGAMPALANPTVSLARPLPATGAARLERGPLVAIAILVVGVAVHLAIRAWEATSILAENTLLRRLDAYARHAQQTADALRTGSQEVPPMVEWPGALTSHLHPWMAQGLQWFAGAASVWLAIWFAFGGLRRIRAARGERTGLTAAVAVLWAPLWLGAWAVAMHGLGGWIQDPDLTAVLQLLASGLLLAAAVWFVRWETRRQRPLVAAGVSVPFGSAFTVAGLLVWLVLVGFVGQHFARNFRLHGASYEPAITTMPMHVQHLQGMGMDSVVRRLGPPVAIECSGAGQLWAYRGATGQVVAGALRFAGDEVVAVDAAARVLLPENVLAGATHLGQRIAFALAANGPLVASTHDGTVWIHEFRSGVRVHEHQGRVVGVSGP